MDTKKPDLYMRHNKDGSVHPESMYAHSPGPWTVGHFGDVRGADGYYSLATVNSHYGLPATANARLMASAPELLAALQKADELLSLPMPFDGSALVVIRAAIANATNTH